MFQFENTSFFICASNVKNAVRHVCIRCDVTGLVFISKICLFLSAKRNVYNARDVTDMAA